MYQPGAGHTVGVERIVDAFRRCDGVIVSSPAYHGSVSGLLKNAFWLPRAQSSMRFAAGPHPSASRAQRLTKLFDENGNCVHSTMISQLETVGQQVVEFANWRRFGLTRPAPLHNHGVENPNDQYAART
jgi:FMN reductase